MFDQGDSADGARMSPATRADSARLSSRARLTKSLRDIASTP